MDEKPGIDTEGIGIAESRRRARGKDPKRAVVVIHGMGSQSPMATLRGLVEAVWTRCTGLAKRPPPQTWSKRDMVSNNFELRRITTSADIKDLRIDFFEFYWADLIEGTQFSAVLWWFKRLFVRPFDRVPPAVRQAWILGIAANLLVLLALVAETWLLVLALASLPTSLGWVALWLLLAAALALGLWFLRHRVLVEVVGDAACYLTAAPENIAARSRIRAKGLDLLTALHTRAEYDRIILVCHSLGTVVGYDLLNFYWGTVSPEIHHDSQTRKAVGGVEDASAELRANPDRPGLLEQFRDAQGAYAKELRKLTNGGWKITDFVTLGSPLTHAHFLLVDDREPLFDSDRQAIAAGWLSEWYGRLDAVTRSVAALFSARIAQREFPVCPPLAETRGKFTYDTKRGYYVPHNAAVFAPVRWTNIYAPVRNVLWGDVVGGPVAPLFGPGIRDVPLTGAVADLFVAHTHYWDLDRADDRHLDALRAAINLLDEPDGKVWAANPA